jgi:threonine aldolase
MKALKRIVDLRSDTVTRMSESMHQALRNAAVGDDVYDDDPTLNKLQDTVAKLFGKERGLLTLSGTMSNLISILVHCKRGEYAIIQEHSHINVYEQGNIASIAGIFPVIIPEEPDATYDLAKLKSKILPSNQHFAIPSLVTMENSFNFLAGKALPLDFPKKLSAFAKQHGLKTHLDGSRLLNSYYFHKETNKDLKEKDLTEHFDSVCMCLSKGLRCPLGSVLVGSDEFIRQAHRWRKALGGGFRQAGYIAAAALQSLEEASKVFPEDQKHAREMAAGLEKLGYEIFPSDTNFVVFKPRTKLNITEYVAKAKEAGIYASQRLDGSIRAVLHENIKSEDIEYVITQLSLIN